MTSLHDPLLTIDEAAELLGTGPGLPLRLVAEGRLEYVTDGDGVRIPQSALIAYVIAASGGRAPGEYADPAITTEHYAA
ncbi:MAG: Excisionase [Actinomycetota bacterium]|nr:Excisionase [Actinomycetota bacterium]